MREYLNAAHLHVVDRLMTLVMPAAVLAFAFLLSVVTAALSAGGGDRNSGGVLALPCFLAVVGMTMLTRTLPFALALGITRRAYYAGAVVMAVLFSGWWSVVVTVGAAVEAATGGWGMRAYFFRIRAIPGPWYHEFLASFAVMLLLFVVGLWCGLIFRRWGIVGIAVGAFLAAAVSVAVLVGAPGAWPAVGRHLVGLGGLAGSGLVVAAAALLALAAYPAVRRVAV